MNVQLKSRSKEMYRPPPGYAFTRSKTPSRPKSADSKPGKSGDAEEVDVGILCKAISNTRLRNLRMKQNVMETFMRRLLKSMKELKELELKRGKSVYLDKQRRLKLTRMLQILMLQRRNLQLQTETLQKGLIELSNSHEDLQKKIDCLVCENGGLRKSCNQVRNDMEFKTIQIEALLKHKASLLKQIENQTAFRIQSENANFEVKRLRVENENLKEAIQQIEGLLRSKVQEREAFDLKYNQLKHELDAREANDATLRIRVDRLTTENQVMRQELTQHQAGRSDAQMVSAEVGRVRDKYGQLQREHMRLQRLYTMEAETRKALHNQLQEVRGNLRVLCRCRPSVTGEPSAIKFHSLDRITVPCVSRSDASTYRRLGTDEPVHNCHSDDEESFVFNHVFRQSAGQLEVFDEIRPLIVSCIDGYNVCIMAYGPTGSGKTYTMQGTPRDPGVGMCAVNELFELCQSLHGIWEVRISVAILEIHNEIVYDLLTDQSRPVKLSDDGIDVRLVDAEEKVTNTVEDMLYWIAKGHKRRKVTATKLNMESSRSHNIVRIQVNLTNRLDKSRRNSSLILCDLAGSESAERIEAHGEVHVETGYINKSLVTLARVFEVLRRRNQCHQPGVCTALVPTPYRDSKLTHLLKPCLSGQAKCVLIITVSGDIGSLDRTLKALEFGQQALQISLGPARPNERILTSRCSKKRVRSAEPNSQPTN